MTKQLNDKAVDIKGKQYVLVSDRILYLSEIVKDYSMETDITFHASHEMWVVKATLTIGNNKFTGHAQEIIGDGYINKTSALENCETSAVGRACAMAGIGVIDSIASVDEVNKAGAREKYVEQVDDKPWLASVDPSVIKAGYSKYGDNLIKEMRKKYKISKKYTAEIEALITTF